MVVQLPFIANEIRNSPMMVALRGKAPPETAEKPGLLLLLLMFTYAGCNACYVMLLGSISARICIQKGDWNAHDFSWLVVTAPILVVGIGLPLVCVLC